ncbi:TonB-linked outer membrane protein, SusC/RagA family [Chitinophaga costaii]|uniref:TonB-linked outer membrane protein, SusC/RagA family n=1 Tax=Chitinophaga costaii TaxID=1335309 RepID=A0A1C4G222_9BACT|nr:TonB-dependent receptor [Chitinophaga costaii]PUZ19767.1 TonB-dependent receptor [Chitinophaga costaii]SCC62206.1 TonB-linked outer membrane protein, SusC/RagA family [Chitinophaga costaii]
MKRGVHVMLMFPLALLLPTSSLLARQVAASADQPVVAAEALPAAAAPQPEEVTLKFAFQEIEDKFSVSIAYKSELVKSKKLQFAVNDFKSPEEALEKALKAFPLHFEKVREHFYMVTEKELSGSGEAIQQDPVQGVVRDEKGNALAGVTVKVKGTSIGTVTDITGHFKLQTPGTTGEQLEVTYIGFETQTINIRGQLEFNLILKESSSSLNEVVVTGYTTQKKKDLTGAVSVVKMDALTRQPTSDVTSQLQGQASGVTVVGGGQPGQQPDIRIRGVNTFGDNTPLYVVDGVPTGNVSDINPADIASMQVLKDAGAASIYGARASNGVIIVTTKRGGGKIKITYDGYYGVQHPKGGNVLHTLNTQEMANLRWKAMENPGSDLYGYGTTPVIPDYIAPKGAMEGDPSVDPSLYNVNPNYTSLDEYNNFYRITRANKQGTDWYHAVFKNAPITSHNLTATGSTDKASYLFSLNYFNQQGTLDYTYYKRYTLRSNTSYNITDHIRVGENLAFSMVDNPQVAVLSPDGILAMVMREQPIIPVYDIKGNFAGSYGGNELGDAENPVANQYRTRNNKGFTTRLFGNVFAEVDLFKKFTLRTSFGGDVGSDWAHSFSYPTYENKEYFSINQYSQSADNSHEWTWTNTLTYHSLLGKYHDLKVIVGTEANDSRSNSVGGSTSDYYSFDPPYPTLSTGSGLRTNYSDSYIRSLFSLIGRVDYAFKDKYLIGFTIRRDGSSVFVDNKYGNFPAVSAAWRISDEKFMKGITWLTDLKIRGSYGIMGNQQNPSQTNGYTTFAGVRTSSYYDLGGTNNSIVEGFQPSQIGAPQAKWEKDINTNVGFDATLLGDHIDISADYYQKDIKDLLYNPTMPGLVGTATTPYINVGSMQNHGIDLSLGGHTTIAHDLRLDATITFTAYKNKVVKVADNSNYFDIGKDRLGNIIRNQVGHPTSAFFGYKIDGFFNSQEDIDNADAQARKNGDPDAIYETDEGIGRFKYKDVNGDGQITPDDRTFLGSPHPDFAYGLNLGLAYKGFDFSMTLYGTQGNDIWNSVLWWRDFYGNFASAKSKTALYNSWTDENHHAKAPKQEEKSYFSTGGTANSYYIENGSYLRCKNMQLGYTLPSSLLGKYGVTKVHIYVQAANLFTITKYSGLDPELSGGVTGFGVDNMGYPNQRQYLVGLNVGF